MLKQGPQCQIYLSDRVLYLPHHGVITEKKPDKLRIVFDCASKYLGESLNQKYLPGPDINNKLIHVLFWFREHEYAVTADIEAIYHQAKKPSQKSTQVPVVWWRWSNKKLQDDITFIWGNLVCQRFYICIKTHSAWWSRCKTRNLEYSTCT